MRSQDIPKVYHDTGSYYFYKTSKLLKKGNRLSPKTTYTYIDRINSIDINDLSDLKIAENKVQIFNKKWINKIIIINKSRKEILSPDEKAELARREVKTIFST